MAGMALTAAPLWTACGRPLEKNGGVRNNASAGQFRVFPSPSSHSFFATILRSTLLTRALHRPQLRTPQITTLSMAPKRKVAAKATPAADDGAAAKKVKPDATPAAAPKAGKGLIVGAPFPDLGPLENDEGKMVDLKVCLGWVWRDARSQQGSERAFFSSLLRARRRVARHAPGTCAKTSASPTSETPTA